MNLEETYDKNATQLYRHALVLTKNHADAEDVLQSVFVKLAVRLRAGTEVRDSEAYLHTAIRRAAVRVVERRRPGIVGSAVVVAKNGLAPEATDQLNDALRRLPAEQSEVLMLHVYENMTFSRIGEVLGIPADTAASRYRYAKNKLKEWLRDDG